MQVNPFEMLAIVTTVLIVIPTIFIYCIKHPQKQKGNNPFTLEEDDGGFSH